MTQLLVERAAAARGTMVCRAVGELDLVGAGLLRRLTTDLGAITGPVEIDLAGVTFIDSSGLTALVGMVRRTAEHGTELRFTNPRPSVARVLSITGVDRVLGLEPEHSG